MANNAISVSGINYSLDAGVVNFFGANGISLGDEWYIDTYIGELMIQVVKSDKTHQAVLKCIETDTGNGKRKEIAYVIVGARAAVVLYLDKTITAEHLRKATEGPHYVDIPDVVFDGLPLTVRVDGSQKDLDFVATADKDCVIIK